MRVCLVGVGCVGKSTIGRLLAGRLGVPFLDLDEEIERHFATSIERLRARQLTEYSYRAETAVVLRALLEANADCVVAVAPSGLRDAYLRVQKKVDCVVVAIEDTAENILRRITFYDVDSRPLEVQLSERERRLHLAEIRKDITYFRKSYQRADLHADIAGLDAEGSAARIQELLATFRGRPPVPVTDTLTPRSTSCTSSPNRRSRGRSSPP